MAEIRRLALPEVLLIAPVRHGDSRGFFSETYSRRELATAGFDKPFVQDNHSLSGKRGILRGLHFQRPPHAQDKLVRVTRGAVFDVAVDIRKGSSSFGQWVGVELSEENWRQMLIPVGFAHGFVTLTETAEVLYKVTDDYAPECEDGLAWNDPEIGVEWPLPASEITTNARDGKWPKLSELEPL
ncbi:MAG TPA: dTDP-4-dehydrorhamnose 3,5-epimerase [Caulobacteraceae bacterium]|jgi:dTDP-4-dehydrorhamnose 3,5-epimerase|nr:dTDP-4-dehydrorhamnose 3,5-epimerase [Caulobacteraceae bacterium]